MPVEWWEERGEKGGGEKKGRRIEGRGGREGRRGVRGVEEEDKESEMSLRVRMRGRKVKRVRAEGRMRRTAENEEIIRKRKRRKTRRRSNRGVMTGRGGGERKEKRP